MNCSVSSDVTFANWSNQELMKQYANIIEEYVKTEEKVNPTTLCSMVEGAMHSWIGFSKYIWLKEREVDGKFYPKIAVKRGKNNDLIL